MKTELPPHQLDHPDGPHCRCGKPSRYNMARHAYSFDVRLRDGSVIRPICWLDRNGNIRAMIDNTEYVGPSLTVARRFIQNDPKRMR
jgi:hypothetical protein